MSQNKNIAATVNDRITVAAGQAGMLLMTAATITGMMELPNHANNRVVLPGQPVFVAATENGELNNPVRREREESAPHFISYAVTQRTSSRAAKK